MIGQAEYIWQDGTSPTPLLRSKTLIVTIEGEPTLESFRAWSFDGSSTNQAVGNNSDCELRPVSFICDPIRGEGNYLVLCEVYDEKGQVHPSNTRAILRNVLEAGAAEQEPTFGFEQEYTIFDGATPLGFPKDGSYPAPQGPYYCSVGGNRTYGRELVEVHTEACIDAGLLIYGINAEVMPGQWEFQIGYRGFKGDVVDALTICDHMTYATWLLHRLSEEFGYSVSFDNKPMKGDWNGAGCHTNFSTKDMRHPDTGKEAIEKALALLSDKHDEHISVYGDRNNERLTGDHETCDINTFRHGTSDRGASIRIPLSTAQKGYGYLEDRRPGANSDHYVVSARILETICDIKTGALV